MKIIYLVFLVALTSVMMRLCYKIRSTKNDLIHSIFLISLITISAAVFNVGSVLYINETVALWAFGIFSAFVDWILFGIFQYTKTYMQRGDKHDAVDVLFFALSTIDSISLCLNGIYGHAFEIEPYFYRSGEKFFIISRQFFAYELHEIFIYFTMLVIVVDLLIKILHTKKIYRIKYVTIIVLITAAAGVSFISMTDTDIPIDLSFLCYEVLVLVLYYVTVRYVPERIIMYQLSNIVKSMNNGIACYDEDGECIYTNEKMDEFMNAADANGVRRIFYERCMDRVHRDADGADRYEWHYTNKDRFYRIEYNRIFDDDGGRLGCYFYIDDETEDIRKFREESHRTSHDELTGLCNAAHFSEKLETLLAESNDAYYLIYSDIVDFKLINELFGHETGNKLLKKQAEFLQKVADEKSVYGRINDDHFAFVTPKSNYKPEYFDECIREMKVLIDNSIYKLQIKFGIYEITNRKESVSAMCDKAIIAIGSANSDSEACIAFYDEKLLEGILHEKAIIGQFDTALSNGEFKMFLQPQITVDGVVTGAEALVRWVKQDGKVIPPGEFIPVLEKTGFVYKMDRYIWELAAAKLSQWKAEGREDMHISVNISPKDIYFLDIYSEFTGLVEKYGISPKKLNLEITETVFMSDMTSVIKLIDRLKNYGFLVEIDDFGSGYSSLNMLKDIRADLLKIDMVFLRETENKQKNRIILDSIISMAGKLDMPVIAEGVEYEEQVKFLTDMGCDMFQGYYFSKPIQVSEFEEKYMNN